MFVIFSLQDVSEFSHKLLDWLEDAFQLAASGKYVKQVLPLSHKWVIFFHKQNIDMSFLSVTQRTNSTIPWCSCFMALLLLRENTKVKVL